jgi:hypothetical protein
MMRRAMQEGSTGHGSHEGEVSRAESDEERVKEINHIGYI